MKEDEIRKELYNHVKSKSLKGLVEFKTNLGSLSIQVDCNYVPKTGENFIELCETGYYNTTKFHRLIPNFMVQGGDPTGKGSGGESIFGEDFEDEFHPSLNHSRRGTLAMANSGPGTNGS